MTAGRLLLVATLAVGSLGWSAAWAADPLGTAGRFRAFGWANCGKPIMEQMQGACDPVSVADRLPARARAEAHLKRAVALVSFLRMVQAAAAVDEALKADPKHADALVFRARLSMSQMRADAAERDLTVGLDRVPRNPYLLATRAEYLLDLGNLKSALSHVNQALHQRPDDVDMLWIRARTWMALQQRDQAETDLDRALAIEPNEQRIRLFRAQLHLRRGEFERAIVNAEVLLKGRPDVSALEVRAMAYAELDRNAEAVADLTAILGEPGTPSQASPQFPHFNQLLVQRATLLVRLGRTVEASRDLDTIVAVGGKPALLRLQVLLRRNGFADLPLDGQRSAAFDSALQACVASQTCGRGLIRSL